MDADGSKWRDQARWSLSAERLTSAAVEDTALSSEQTAVLRASVGSTEASKSLAARFDRIAHPGRRRSKALAAAEPGVASGTGPCNP